MNQPQSHNDDDQVQAIPLDRSEAVMAHDGQSSAVEVRVSVSPPKAPAPTAEQQDAYQARQDAADARRRFIEERDHAEAMWWQSLNFAVGILRPTSDLANASAANPDELLRYAVRIQRLVTAGEAPPVPPSSSPLPAGDDVARSVADWMQRPPGVGG